MIDYEKGATNPDTRFLAAIFTAGADVQYILTGIRSISPTAHEPPRNPILDKRVQAINELYEALTEVQQKEILVAIEEKKRINKLEETTTQLLKKTG